MSHTTPLFRAEVMQAAPAQWLGSIYIGRPLGFTVVTGVALVMAACLIGFAWFGEYTRKVTLSGVLLPKGGVMDISSPLPGTVVDVLVREGESVLPGQPLVRLRAERQTSGGELSLIQAGALAQRRHGLETELQLAESQSKQREVDLREQIRSHNSDILNLQGELEAAQQRVQLARTAASNFEDLASKGFVPRLQTQQKLDEVLDQSQRERNVRRLLEAARRDLASLQSERIRNQGGLAVLRAQLQGQLAGLAQEGSELDARAGWTLTAPQAGTVATLNAVRGQSAITGHALVSLLPTQTQGEQLLAQLYGPSRTIGFVEPGQKVWLSYAPYPYQKFGLHAGRVTGVSRTPVNPTDLPSGRANALLSAAQSQEPLYRVTVQLDAQHVTAYGKPQALKSGMGVQARVRQDRRAIWEWLLEPLLTLNSL